LDKVLVGAPTDLELETPKNNFGVGCQSNEAK
jgi:hypothetical protein